MNSVDRDIFIVGVTCYCEASDQGQDGVRAVAHAIVNRHKAGKWFSGSTLAACCVLPFAFSSWNTKDPNRTRAMGTSPQDAVMAMCLQEAAAAINGDTIDPTDGATHYYADGTQKPSWVSGKNDKGEQVAPPAIFIKQIGKHLFFKDVQ